MENHLEHLVERIEDDPFFLGCLLRLYPTAKGSTTKNCGPLWVVQERR